MWRWWKVERTDKNKKLASFWGPVAVVLSAISLFNAFSLGEHTINVENLNGAIFIILAIVLLIAGLRSCMYLEDKKVFAGAGITVGVSAIFYGGHVVLTVGNCIGYLIDVIVVIIGFIFVRIGIKKAP
jgi:hypothetical protein